MLENATPSGAKPGGRPPEFDREHVLDAAVTAFWTSGYKGTTVRDLERATGIDRSTLYRTFGGKDGLYRAAADTYVEMASTQLFAVLHHGTHGVVDVLTFIDTLAGSFRAGQPPGCLIVNDMASVGEHDATRRYLNLLGTGLRAALTRASDRGEFPLANFVPLMGEHPTRRRS
ncbi:MAG: TetR/AcrR family transcriptional regulator [Actinomycetota bacterium]